MYEQSFSITVPFAIKTTVENELLDLESKGILRKIDTREFATIETIMLLVSYILMKIYCQLQAFFQLNGQVETSFQKLT